MLRHGRLRFGGFSALPSARIEAKRIFEGGTFGAAQPILGPAVTLLNLASQLTNATHIHFATHGKFDSEYPNFSSLQLGREDRMYVIDFRGMSFASKHVFLSACQTRLGN